MQEISSLAFLAEVKSHERIWEPAYVGGELKEFVFSDCRQLCFLCLCSVFVVLFFFLRMFSFVDLCLPSSLSLEGMRKT